MNQCVLKRWVPFLIVGLILLGSVAFAACAGPTPEPTAVPPADTPVPPTDTPMPPTETPVPPTETPIEPAATPSSAPEAEALVPDAVASIIAANCADCHVAPPSSHTERAPGAQNSDQCGLCHIPYGHVASPEHTAITEGCPTCHSSPDVTHFQLRDEEDQAVLAADVEAKCISCHRDSPGGAQADGRGVPPLETEEDIIAAVEQGTLRTWIQPGGFMARHLTADETATITDWIDTISIDRPLSYDPYLDAVKIESDFDLNGLGDNPAWDAAPEHVVSVHPTIYTAADAVRMKALYSDQYLYIRAEWQDSTASLTRSGSWILEDGQWRHPKAATENDKQSEDRFSVIWNISTPNFQDRHGCAIKCHGNVPGSSEFTDLEGSTMDIWHSKAARGLGVYSATDDGNLTIDSATEAFEVTAGTVRFSGVVDDKRLIWYMDLDDGYDLEDSGRRGDAGGSAYSHNRNKDKSAPLFIEIAPDSWADAMVLTEAESTDGSAIVASPDDPAYDVEAVAAAWDNYAALEAVVPERILREPEGSRADVLHAATWQDGVWVNEFRRALVTGNPDDVQFDLAEASEYEFSLTVFDNCGRGEIPPGHTTYGDGQYQLLRFK